MNIEEKYNKLIEWFYEISKVPRNSTQEEKIAEFLCDFARSRNLEFKKDEFYNVIIKKKATEGYENKKEIIFQAHTDMVCEKDINSKHDFYIDPIEIINENSVLRANGTTLGADDGIGVACLLLLLDDNEIVHPDIYCLFTTQEEIGMDGAKNFDYTGIKASYLINIDGEEEDTAIVGCAGGIRLKYTKNILNTEEASRAYKLKIYNLRGGHSGVDINKNRKNSNIICAKILEKIDDIKICAFSGGNKDNAIPNQTECIFCTNYDKQKIELIIKDIINSMDFVDEDKDYKIVIEDVENKYESCSNLDSKLFLEDVQNLKQGVIEYSKDKEGLVETSGNVGIVKLENGKIILTELLRSSDDEKRDYIADINNNYAKERGYEIEIDSTYPGWKYKSNSNLEKVFKESYIETHEGKDPKIEAIHAGVECGMIFKKMPNLELISIGPDIKDVHTINETLYLNSCKTFLKTLLKVIEKLD